MCQPFTCDILLWQSEKSNTLTLPAAAAAATAAAKSLQSCLTLCNPIEGSPPGSAFPGILQARTLEWVAISFQCLNVKSESEVAQSCPTLRDPMDCSLPGSSVHGISKARVLEWVAIAFSMTLPATLLQRNNFCVIVISKCVLRGLI